MCPLPPAASAFFEFVFYASPPVLRGVGGNAEREDDTDGPLLLLVPSPVVGPLYISCVSDKLERIDVVPPFGTVVYYV